MSWDSESKSQISISTEATTVDKEPEYYERFVRPDMRHIIWPEGDLAPNFDFLTSGVQLNKQKLISERQQGKNI